MKKHYLGIMSLAVLAAAFGSCQFEERGTTINGEVDFSIRAEIPSVLSTYAQPDLRSHLGGYNNLDQEVYDLRYVLEVWTDETTPQLAYRTMLTKDNFEGATFEARLLAKKYRFVFWADFVEQDGESNLIYNADDLTAVSYATDDRYAGQDVADAYYAVVPVDLTVSGQSIKDVKLKRPFGKIRLVATDELSGTLQSERPAQARVVYGNYNVPTTFNALTGAVSGSMEAGSYQFEAKTETGYVLNGTAQEGKTAYILGYDYIFASEETPSYAFDVTVFSDETASQQIGTRSISEIPVQANKLTTVVGNFFSNSANLQVIVEDEFDGENQETLNEPTQHVVNPGDDLQSIIDAAEDGDVIVIGPGVFDRTSMLTRSGSTDKIVLPTDRSLIFRGANAGIAGTAERGEETIINVPIVCDQANITTADFTFDGFTFTGVGQVILYRNDGGNITFINNIVKDTDSGIATFFQQTPGYRDYYIGDVVVENNFVNFANSGSEISCGFTVWSAKSATFRNNSFSNFKHAAAQFDYISEDLNFDGNIFSGCEKYEFRVQVVNIGGERNYGSNAENVTEKGFMKIERTGTGYDNFTDVLNAAQEGDVVIVAPGEYPLDKNIEASDGQMYYLPVETKGLTLRSRDGRDNTVIYGREYSANGAISSQNLITVMAENVTIEGFTIMPKVDVNKTIEIRKSGFVLKDCRITPNTFVTDNNNGKGGSVYFTYPDYKYNAGAMSATVTGNIIEKASVSFDHIYEGTFEVSGNIFDGGNMDSPMFTTPIWGQVELDKLKESKLVVNFKNNEFKNVAEYNGSNNPVIRPSYGIVNLEDNKFPTDGIYWAAMAWDSSNTYGNYCDFGSVFVNYNSVIDRAWSNDPDLEGAPGYNQPKSFAISNDIIEFETTEDMQYQGRVTTVDMQESSYWEVVSTLTLTGENMKVNKCISLYLDYEYVEFRFRQDAGGNRTWQYWMPESATGYDDGGEFFTISDSNIPTENGEYEIKIAFNNGIITHFINGQEVASYRLGPSKTKIGTIALISYGYGESYKTTWTYPVVK